MKEVKHIGNFYGGLVIKEFECKFYWIIENYDTNFEDISKWSEIPENLYRELEKECQDEEFEP